MIARIVVLHLLVEFLRPSRLRGPRETGVRAKLRRFYAVGFRFLDGGDRSGSHSSNTASGKSFGCRAKPRHVHPGAWKHLVPRQNVALFLEAETTIPKRQERRCSFTERADIEGVCADFGALFVFTEIAARALTSAGRPVVPLLRAT